MSITDEFHFDKAGEVERSPRFRRYFLTIIIALVALLAFGVGRLTGESREGVKIEYKDIKSVSVSVVGASQEGGNNLVVASSKGTKYYFVNCKNTISEQNKVTFATALMAEKAGYTLATNCKAP